jgi:NADPH:quinone reductase-like Zn-dependent oxidoreductase/NAD(P)-dependent dehydrogenase (short-subunit alcohol dehydrogenase family)
MVWVTYGGAVKGRDPRSAFMTGLLRAVATGNPAGRFLSIDVDAEEVDIGHKDQPEGLVRAIVHHATSLRSRDWSRAAPRDTEYSWQDGCMWVSRLVPDTDLAVHVEPEKTPQRVGSQLLPIGSQGPVRAAFETPGLLASLYFRPYAELAQPLQADYIDVKVAAVGLNWKDLSLTSGRFDSAAKHLSSEYAGVVARTGEGVTGLAVGDRVCGMGRGHFGTYTRVPAALAHRMQPSDTFEQTATMPVVYMTAVYALDHLAHLRCGQKVLIQSASGGMGLAAIHIARCRGAEIFVTASGANKVAFLADTMGIPRERIFPSRDAAALSRAAELAGKGGFHVILSTAQRGDQLSDNLKALAPGGHLLDMSRLDVLEAKALGLELFQKNASFHSFDLNSVLDNDPELGTELLKTVDELLRAGRIAPIPCLSVTDLSELDQTMQSFAKCTHVGKLVVSFQNPNSVVKMVTQPAQARFDPEARYVVTGGFGGLGRSIIRWMADRGAHDFIVLSRRGVGPPEAQLLVDDLSSRGVRFENVPCDVSHRAEVVAVIEKAKSAGRPIRGVVHTAFSLSDLSFEKISIDEWQSGIAAKTVGTVNLHEATASLSLDFFVLTTTTESVWAPATQAAYIAASNFQEYFARYRRRLGLPGSTAAYGLVRDVASDFKDAAVGTEDMMVRMMAQTTTEWQVLATFEPAFLASDPSSPSWFGQKHDPLSATNFFTCLDPVVLANMAPATVTPRWFSDARASLIMRTMDDAQRHRAKNTGARDGDGAEKPEASSGARLRQAFDEAIKAGAEKRASTIELVTEAIVKTVADMLFVDVRNVNPAKSVAGHRVDSLIAAELRHWFLQALATNLKMLDLLDAQTSIRGLAESIVDKALQH